MEGQTLYAREDDVERYTKSHLKDRREVFSESVINNKGGNEQCPQGQKIEEKWGIDLWA